MSGILPVYGKNFMDRPDNPNNGSWLETIVVMAICAAVLIIMMLFVSGCGVDAAIDRGARTLRQEATVLLASDEAREIAREAAREAVESFADRVESSRAYELATELLTVAVAAAASAAGYHTLNKRDRRKFHNGTGRHQKHYEK